MLSGYLTITDDSVLGIIASKDFKENISAQASKITQSVKVEISAIISRVLFGSATVNDLLNGKLKDDFGLTGNLVTTAIQNIINHISQNIEIKVEQGFGNTAVVVKVNILPGDLGKITSVPGGSYVSYGIYGGGNVDWLEWLLTRGTQVVIGKFWLFPYAEGRTRSGGTSIMEPIIGKKDRDSFRVDPNHAGTLQDNFITRALEPAFYDILNLVAAATVRSVQ